MDNVVSVGEGVKSALDYIRNSPLSSLTPNERKENAAWRKNTKYRSRVAFGKNNHYVRVKITEDNQYIIHSMKKSHKRQYAYDIGAYAEAKSTNYRRVQMGLFDRFKKTSKESLLGYLQNSISDNSSLEHIVNVFEEMCNMPLKEDMILFETGTYSFTGKPMFNFSLVRQFPNDEEEYYQIHVDVLYIPTEENKDFQRTIWNEDIEEDIFSYIKKTPEFNFCKDKVFSKIEIYLDET